MTIFGKLAKRMIKAAGLDWEIHLTLDRDATLKNAGFVTTQFRVGSLDACIKKERIPLIYGILGQETDGAGGILKAFRTIPVVLDVVEDMKRLCPNARLINFTNPAGMVTEAVTKYGAFDKVIGLCNVPIVHEMGESKLINKEQDNLFFHFAGINHFHWHKVYDENGLGVTNEIMEKVVDEDVDIVENILNVPFIPNQVRQLKMLPCFYHRYYYLEDLMLEYALQGYAKNETRAEVVKQTEFELFELYKDENLDYKPEQLSERGGAYYSDTACEIISSIHNDKRNVLVVNTKNNGALSDLDRNSIIEISSIITSSGPKPIAFGTLPPAQRGQLQMMKAMEELTMKPQLREIMVLRCKHLQTTL